LHPAPFPEQLANDHIISWSNEWDTVLDPFAGSGTTLKMAKKNNRNYVGIEISEEYCDIIRKRLN
jgi:site-specific DNA-methyltransferase (adenine-specific)